MPPPPVALSARAIVRWVSPLSFGLHNPALAFVDRTLLWLALLGTTAAFYRARAAAGRLLVPDAVWVTFAAALNLALWRLNS